jgi:DNA-binding PadR family transcriptional regulator
MKNIPQHHHRGRGHRGGPGNVDGFGPWGPSFGPGGGPGMRRGHRRRRGGDVRAATLLILDEAPAHGYHIITTIAERSDGGWSPSPGSIYPVLSQLEDEGLIDFERVDGRKTASLTEAGRTYVDEHRDELGTPWELADQARPSGEHMALMKAGRSLAAATQQVAVTGSETQIAAAASILTDARKQMYMLLANDED